MAATQIEPFNLSSYKGDSMTLRRTIEITEGGSFSVGLNNIKPENSSWAVKVVLESRFTNQTYVSEYSQYNQSAKRYNNLPEGTYIVTIINNASVSISGNYVIQWDGEWGEWL